MHLKPLFSRFIAILLILTAAAGFGMSIAGLVAVQKARTPVLTWSMQQTALLRDTLTTLDDTLSLVEQTLGTASNSLSSVNETLAHSADTLRDSQPLLDEFKGLLDKSLPETIQDTQNALYAAQKDAASIEATLSLLSNIPFMPGEPYQPEQSLSEALGQVAYTVGQIPHSTEKISSDLDVAKSNLALMQVSLMSMSLQLDDIEQNLAQARALIPQYHDLVTRARQRLKALEAGLPPGIKGAAGLLSALLLWIAATQIGLFLQGLDWWQRAGAQDAPPQSQPAEAPPA